MCRIRSGGHDTFELLALRLLGTRRGVITMELDSSRRQKRRLGTSSASSRRECRAEQSGEPDSLTADVLASGSTYLPAFPAAPTRRYQWLFGLSYSVTAAGQRRYRTGLPREER
jgi:hypothetical protein